MDGWIANPGNLKTVRESNETNTSRLTDHAGERINDAPPIQNPKSDRLVKHLWHLE